MVEYRIERRPAAAPVVLSAEQAAVASHRRGVLLVLGGPRTGKTTALVQAAVTGLLDGLPHALFIAASRRARLAIRETVAAAHPELAPRLTVATIHSLAQDVVRGFGGEPTPPGLLSAARQDAYVAQILAGQAAKAWPERFAAARRTRQFANDVREAVAALQRAGLAPADVAARARAAGRDDWAGLARFYQEYLDILGLAGVVDYQELLIRAGGLLDTPAVADAVRPPGSLVIVDGAEDLDPGQAGIISALVTPGTAAILSADPDSRVYSFRGARARSATELVHDWAGRGLPAAVIPLREAYDTPRAVHDALAPIRSRIPLPPGVGTADLAAYRQARPDRAGEAVKLRFADPDAEAGHIAAWLRRAHLKGGVAYEDMAILVRRKDQFGPYALACGEIGVPVVVSGDEIQLGHDGIVAALLATLRIVLDDEESEAGLGVTGLAAPVRKEVVAAGRGARHGSVAEILWAVWEAGPWQAGLLAETAAPGGEAVAAHRSLDAVVALFRLADRFSDMEARPGLAALVAAIRGQEIPDDLPGSSVWNAGAVRLTTAHRAKGWSWPLVVVAGVEEGTWPRRAPTPTLIPLAGLTPQIGEDDEAERLAGERRVFFAACLAATSRLLVTAVDDPDRRPSGFFTQLGAGEGVADFGPGARDRPEILTTPALVGRLRQVAADEAAAPGLRQAACDRLAALAADPVFRGADPDSWWSAGPVAGSAAGSGAPSGVTLRASQVGSVTTCPRRWYLASRAQAEPPAGVKTRIGSLVHDVVRDPRACLETMTRAIEQAWPAAGFPSAWQSRHELAKAIGALGRYDRRRETGGREALASEYPVSFEVDIGGPVAVLGRIDRVERDPDGRVWIVDYKTGANLPTAAQAAADPQLGVYQLAFLTGALDEVTGPGAELGGAELVYLMSPAGKDSVLPKVLAQPSLRETPQLDQPVPLPVLEAGVAPGVAGPGRYPTWVHHSLAAAAAVVREGTFPAVASDACRGCAFARGCPAVDSDNTGEGAE